MNVGFVVSRVLEESKHVNPNCFTVTAPAPPCERMTNTRYIGMKNANTANSLFWPRVTRKMKLSAIRNSGTNDLDEGTVAVKEG